MKCNSLLPRLFLLAALVSTVSPFPAKGILFAQEDERPSAVGMSKRELIRSGKAYYSSRDYAAAVKEWEAALALDPQDRVLEKYLREARRKLGAQAKASAKRKDRLIRVTAPPEEPAANIMSLEECIAVAVKNHLPLQIAKRNVKLAEMRVFEARRNMLPTFGVRWEEVDGRVNAKRYIGKKQSLEGQQPVFHGGELYFTMKQTETNLKIVREEYNRIRNELVLQVKKAYYTLAKAKENLTMQERLKGEIERIYGMVGKASAAGAVSKLEFLNVSSQESQASYQLVSAEGDVSMADLILKQAMNLEANESVDTAADLDFEPIDIDEAEVMRAAFANRPEMRINSLMVTYYDYEKKIAKAKGWPKVDLMGSWGLAKEEFASEDFDHTANGDINRKLEQQWYAGFKASLPFWGSTVEYSQTREQWVPVVSTVHGTLAKTDLVKFNFLDNLKYYSDREAAEIDYDRARQEFIKIKQDITLEAKESHFGYEKALIQLVTAERKIIYQEKDLELVRLKRSMDEAQDSNVVESMIKLAQEKFGYVQALVDCHISLAAVNKAIGVDDYFKAKASGQSGGDVATGRTFQMEEDSAD